MRDLLFLAAVCALHWGPQYFFKLVIEKAGANRPPLPLNGHEVARLLLDQAGLTDVKVEDEPPEAPAFDDHYDPEQRVVALSPSVARRNTVAAYAIAAHEVGHAVQHATGDEGFDSLQSLKQVARYASYSIFLALPIALLLPPGESSRTGGSILLFFVLAITVGTSLLVRFASVSAEWNASFGRGLPALLTSGILPASELPTARRVLFAAASTYIGFAALGVLFLLAMLL